MTVEELLRKLSAFPGDTEVEIYCDNKDLLFEVDGVEGNEGKTLITVTPANGF